MGTSQFCETGTVNRSADWPRLLVDGRDDPSSWPEFHLAHLQRGLKELDLCMRQEGNQLFFSKDQRFQVQAGPVTSWSLPPEPGSLVVRCLAHQRPGAVRFFLDMVTRWLNPSRTLGIQSAYGCEFRFADQPDRLWILMELVVRIETPEELVSVERLLPLLRKELHLGLQSSAHASRFLEMKGMNLDEKVIAIQERITHLMSSRPRHFSADLMNEAQFFLAASKEEFKNAHRARHLTRLILTSYYFRRLAKLHSGRGGRRGVQVKVLPTVIQEGECARSALGVMVGIFPMASHERFDEAHLLAAVRRLLPQSEPVNGSFLVRIGRPSGLCVVYVDIVSADKDFSLSDRSLLRRQLGGVVRQSIAELVPPMFAPRNEEEVMRHIVTLSQQLRYVTDAPQVIVSFERQTGAELVFTVIVLRLQRGGHRAIDDVLESCSSLVGEWALERRRMVGLLRKRHPKEASILRVTLPSSPFLRQDHTVDLVKARMAVSQDLEKILGLFRDYNGGMLQQQRLVLEEVRGILGEMSPIDSDYLEHFFHAIAPGERRALLRADLIAVWFRAFQELQAEAEKLPDQPYMRYASSNDVCWVLTRCPDSHLSKAFNEVRPLVAQDRDSVHLQLALPGCMLHGVMTMSGNGVLRNALQTVFLKR